MAFYENTAKQMGSIINFHTSETTKMNLTRQMKITTECRKTRTINDEPNDACAKYAAQSQVTFIS
jgi:hypothetical protein